jgi:hypothetical protein
MSKKIDELVIDVIDVIPLSDNLVEFGICRAVLGISVDKGRVRLDIAGADERTFWPTDMVTVWRVA